MRAVFASRASLAAAMLASIAIAPVASAESIHVYMEMQLSNVAPRPAPNPKKFAAADDLPEAPQPQAPTNAMKGNGAPAQSGPKLMLGSATGVRPHGYVHEPIKRIKIMDRNTPTMPGKPAEFRTK